MRLPLPRLAIAVVLILAATALLVLRQRLVAGPLRAAAEARLTAALGQPVTIGALGLTVLPRVALTGSDIRIGSAENEPPGIRLERIRLVPDVRSLFTPLVRIDELQLDGFVVSVLRNEDGSWQAPAISPAAGGTGPALALGNIRVTRGAVRIFDGAAGGARERGRIDDIDAGVTIGDGALRLSPLEARIGGAQVTGEALADATSVALRFEASAISDNDLPAVLALLGMERPAFVRLEAPASITAGVQIARATARLTGRGTIAAPALALDPLRVSEFRAPFTIDGPRLSFQPTTFSAYGGRHRGAVTVRLDGTPRWTASSDIDRLDIGPFLDALAGRDARLDGTARITATVGAPLGSLLAQELQGRARITVADGVVHDFPLLAAINSAFRLTGGDTRDTRFERLSATMAIGRTRATTDDLLLEARDVRMTAVGVIGFDRSLDLRGRVTLSAERTAAAVASVHELARLTRNGRIEAPLTIGGTLDAPAIRVDVKGAIGSAIQDEFLRRLKRIIR